MRILLLSGGLQGLSCGESLSQKGYSVDVVSNDLQIRKSHFFDNVYSDVNENKLGDILSIVKDVQYDVIIPMGDKNVSLLSENKRMIEAQGKCKCACPDNGLLKIVEDKHHFMNFCEQNEVPHPKTSVLVFGNIEDVAKNIGFPALIKPDYSVGARGITRVDSLHELQSKFPEISEQYGNCTLQELIDNKEYYYNVMLYRTENGEYPAYTISKIVRMYPVDAGSSSCLITVDNEELLNICKDCLDKLGWVGMADFDVLQRLDNGEYKIIEINARVPASLRGAAISGVNFPEIIVNDVMGGDVPQFEYTSGKVMRYMGLDLMWFIKSSNRFRSTPSWFKFFGKGLFYQDIFKEDASTWWTWLAEGILKIGKRNKKLR